ncbi:MAG: protein BatD [Bacteroidetes bacterium]|nr:protein BatD [Bacteroidota bacterium]
MMIFICTIASFQAMSQVNFTTIASSKEIGKTDYVQIEFVVENAQQIEHLQHPSFQDFHIIQGPIQSSGMSVVNGNMSQYKALSFVLQPIKTGKFTIAGATADIDGKQMHSNAVTIIVKANVSSNNQGNSQPMALPAWPGEQAQVDREYFLKPGEKASDKIKKNLFVKVDVSKTNCYVGEPIVATYKLYSRLQSESRVTKHPSLNGFSVYDMIDPNNDASSVEKVNGKPFTVHIIRKAQLIPLQSGTIDLDPVEIDNTVHFLKNSSSKNNNNTNSPRDIFDDLFDESVQAIPVDEHVTLESQPVEISVKPLPEEKKPADFNGAVGHFTVKADIETKNITAQDAAILKLTVKGDGNLPVVNAPEVQWPSGIENYDASTNTKEDIDKTVAPLSGSKTFEYSFTPKESGNYVIPSIQFSFFDPVSASYKTMSTDALNISVGKLKHKSASAPAVSKTSAADEKNSSSNFLQQHLESFFAVLILSGLAIYFMLQNRRLKRQHEEAEKVAAAKKAMELAAVPLPPAPDLFEEAKRLLDTGDYRGFYTEVNRTIWKAVSEEINIPASQLNKYNISLQLQSRGWSAETTSSLIDILNECEMKLYTPDYNTENMQALLQQAEELVLKLKSTKLS